MPYVCHKLRENGQQLAKGDRVNTTVLEEKFLGLQGCDCVSPGK